MIENLSPDEEAELGVIIRAVNDLFTRFGIEQKFLPVMLALLRGTVQTALNRAKPNRRMAFLDQWRQFLCSLPDWLSVHPSEARLSVAEKAISQFELQDRRGRAKPGIPFPAGANCLLIKDGELWFARVPATALDLPRRQTEATPPDQVDRFKAEIPVHEKDVPGSVIDPAKAEYLRPCNQPRVLRREYNRLVASLKKYENLNDQQIWKTEFPDVPGRIVDGWLELGASHADVALLVAATRAGYMPTCGTLSRLRAILALQR